MRPADRDVARPPAHLGPDHVGARPDEAEGDEEGDEEEEMRLAAGVDDPVLVGAADARRGQHGRKAIGACYGIPRVSSQPLAASTPPAPRQRSLPPPPISLSGPRPRGAGRCPPPPTSESDPPPPISRSGERPADQAIAPRATEERPRLTVDHAADHHAQARVGVEGVAAPRQVADDRPDVARRAAHLGRARLAALRVVEGAVDAAAVGVAEALRGGQDEPPVRADVGGDPVVDAALVVQGEDVDRRRRRSRRDRARSRPRRSRPDAPRQPRAPRPCRPRACTSNAERLASP